MTPAARTSMSAWIVTAVAALALGPASGAGAAEQPVTFTEHVAPIVWRHCAGCHRPGEVGPFPLLTYDDVRKRAGFVAEITADRRMPPWKAEPGYGRFHDERRLADDEIALLAAWAKAGAPEGNPGRLPPAPTFPEGWQLGEPDVVLEMPEEFVVPADGRDIYRCFVIPIPMEDDRTVAAVEFRPGNRAVVHHAIFYLDSAGAARRRDAEEEGPGYTSFGGPGVLPTGGLGGWAPGSMPRFLPEGTAKFLRRGSDLVLQVHYHPAGKVERDRSRLGIHFTKRPPEKLVGGIAVMNRKFSIPAGDAGHAVDAASEPLPVDVDVLGVAPHMHLLGKSMKVHADTPDGQQVPLVWIKDWDFNWQGQYGFAEPVRLPKGSVIRVQSVFDNSADNPRNPNTPPKAVRWGEQTTDEMCLLTVQVTTDSLADLRQVARMRFAQLGAALAGGAVEADVAAWRGGGRAAGAGPPPTSAMIDAFIDNLLESGFDIPPKHRAVLESHDGDGDGRIAKGEYDAMPEELRAGIRRTIRGRIEAALKVE